MTTGRCQSPVSESGRMEFRLDCKKILIRATEKLLGEMPSDLHDDEKSVMYGSHHDGMREDDCVAKFGRVLHKMVHQKQVNKEECDRMQREYHAFLQEVAVEEQHYVQGNPV